MKRLCIVTSHDFVVRAFLLGHLRRLAPLHRITLVTRIRPGKALPALPAGVEVIELPIERYIAPLSDLRCLVKLYRLLGAGRFDLVHSITPKAGMLAMMAGRAARVPRRVHTFQGEPWATRRGPSRWILRAIDRMIAALATHVLVVGRSEREFLASEGVVSPLKADVLGHGSIAGVDTRRFVPDSARRAATRRRLGLPEDAVVALFLGRVRREKGVIDLARAFARVAAMDPGIRLLVVGPDEDSLEPEIRASCAAHAARLVMAPETDTPEDYVAAADIVCLPSYREGFPVTILEASAAGVPVLASRIYGTRDAVVDGESGLLHEPGDVDALAAALQELVSDPALRRSLGDAGRRRVVQEFDCERVERALVDYYARLLGA